MASAGGDVGGGTRNVRRVIRIPLVRAAFPNQRITIRYAQAHQQPRAQGEQRHGHVWMCSIHLLSAGEQQPHIRVVPVQLAGGTGEDRSRALREQEEAARRTAEDDHRRAQLRASLSSLPPPLVL